MTCSFISLTIVLELTWIGDGLTLDWRIGHGLALDWQNDLGLNRPLLRHFGRSRIVLVPLTHWGIKTGLALDWHWIGGSERD